MKDYKKTQPIYNYISSIMKCLSRNFPYDPMNKAL